MRLDLFDCGLLKHKRLWGVRYHKERREARGLDAARRMAKVAEKTNDYAMMQAAEKAADYATERAMEIRALCDDETPWESITAGYYEATIRLMGVVRYIGKAPTPQIAARLYDSALFHLWGFQLRPTPRFNFLRPEDLPHNPPPLFKQVEKLREKIIIEANKIGWELPLFNFNFLERHNEERSIRRAEFLFSIKNLNL